MTQQQLIHFFSEHVVACLVILFVIYKILKGDMKIGKNFIGMLIAIWLGFAMLHTLFMTGCGSFKNTTDYVNQHPSSTLPQKIDYLRQTGADAFINVAKDDFKAIYSAIVATSGGADDAMDSSIKCLQRTAANYQLQSSTTRCSTMAGTALESCLNSALCDSSDQSLRLPNANTACTTATACVDHRIHNPTGDSSWLTRFIRTWVG